MRLLNRLRIEVAGGHAHGLSRERRNAFAPQRLHRFDVLGAPARAHSKVHAERLKLFGEPTDTDTEVDAAARQIIEVRHHLGGVHRLTLRHEANAGTEAQPARVRGDERQRRERIEHALRISRNATVFRVGISRRVVREEQHVLRHPHRVKSRFLDESRRIGDVGRRRQMIERERDADLHALELEFCRASKRIGMIPVSQTLPRMTQSAQRSLDRHPSFGVPVVSDEFELVDGRDEPAGLSHHLDDGRHSASAGRSGGLRPRADRDAGPL